MRPGRKEDCGLATNHEVAVTIAPGAADAVLPGSEEKEEAMRRMVIGAAFMVAMLAIAVQPAVAQTMPPSVPPGAAGESNSPLAVQPQQQQTASPPEAKLLDGPVKRVDPTSKAVEVGWFFGLFSTRLAVNDDTHIAVEGEKGSLADIKEGDRVKASYEARDGQNIAKSIEVIPAGAE